MQIRLYGPVEVAESETVTSVGPPQRAAVLAALAADAGRHVATEVLIERVWGDAPPPRARRALHAHLTRIRHLLQQCDVRRNAAASVPRRTGGYRLDIDPGRVDLHQFRRLVDNARQPGVTDCDQGRLLGEALGLWRGEPLSGVAGEWAARTRQGWRREYQDAVLAWARVHLRTGDPAPIIGRLAESVADNPFHEPMVDVLMRALYASGRVVEALDLYTATRTRLVQELGTEPGPDLQRVHQQVLRGDLDLDEPTTVAAAVVTAPPGPPRAVATATSRVVPAQLPHDVRGFRGRADELARLDAILSAGAGPDAPVVISALAGTAGVGKTSLAVHWAHRVADRFPDGQLHLDLRGFGPSGSIVDPADVVRRFLDALGVPAADSGRPGRPGRALPQ